LSDAAKKEESKAAYQKANPPPQVTYKSSTGKVATTKPADAARVQTVRNVTYERHVTYDHRASTFYGGYYGHPVYYNDYFSPFLMGYLFSSAVNANDRALWLYNHRDAMDEARYRDAVSRDAALSARVAELEAQQVQRDPNYVVPAMAGDPDLQYNKDFVDAAYVDQTSGVTVFIVTALVVVLLGVGIYFFFFKNF